MYIGLYFKTTAMKNLAILALVLFGLTSCSKDSLEGSLENLQGPEKSEIMVRVSYLNWSDDQCESSCGIGSEEVVFMVNVDVKLFSGESSQSDIAGIPIIQMTTDKEGTALLEDIDPGRYTIIVETELGIKSRTLTTQLNKRSFIDFSF